MVKKIGIVTIIDNNNYGNRLQNYATQTFGNKIGINMITLNNVSLLNNKNKYIINLAKYYKRKIFNQKDKSQRKINFYKFNENIIFSNKMITAYSRMKKDYDYFLVGSDQVWNPNFCRLRDVDLLTFTNNNNKKIAFSASFGIDKLSEEYSKKTKEELLKFKAISVREDAGKRIVENLTGRTDIEVLIDPTMLLTDKEWDKVSKRPEQIELLQGKKYILNCFLGELSESRKNEINRIAKENDCEIINILDKNSPFYQTGPSEFLYLEKNAFLICTDSFHSCIFAIIYDKPFVVFKREGKSANISSRIETLISKFNLKDREFFGKITQENINHNYTEAYTILENERKKSADFLKKALDIKN